MPTKLTCSKVRKNMVFWPIFDPKIGFLLFYPGKLRVITSKPLLIDSTVKNTSRKVYLEPLAYRAENARKSLDFTNSLASALSHDFKAVISLVIFITRMLVTVRLFQYNLSTARAVNAI